MHITPISNMFHMEIDREAAEFTSDKQIHSLTHSHTDT